MRRVRARVMDVRERWGWGKRGRSVCTCRMTKRWKRKTSLGKRGAIGG